MAVFSPAMLKYLYEAWNIVVLSIVKIMPEFGYVWSDEYMYFKWKYTIGK